MVKSWKNTLFICPNLPSVQRKSTLLNTFYFNTHWQRHIPDPILQTCNLTKLNATLKDPFKYMACKMLSTAGETPPPNSEHLLLLWGSCSVLEQTIWHKPQGSRYIMVLFWGQFLYARLKNGRIMPWQCPSVRPSVRVFRTFLQHALRYQFETWYIHSVGGTTCRVWVASQLGHFDLVYSQK